MYNFKLFLHLLIFLRTSLISIIVLFWIFFLKNLTLLHVQFKKRNWGVRNVMNNNVEKGFASIFQTWSLTMFGNPSMSLSEEEWLHWRTYWHWSNFLVVLCDWWMLLGSKNIFHVSSYITCHLAISQFHFNYFKYIEFV